MSEEDLHAPQTDHAKEVLNVVLPADYQPTKVMESEYSFYSPASTNSDAADARLELAFVALLDVARSSQMP
jgi:hypothetical protein